MVKVQKPTPKTFSKMATIDNPIKKKKQDNKKEKKPKGSEVLIPDVAPSSKKKEKTKKIEATVIEEKVVQKSEKKQKDKKSKDQVNTEVEKPNQNKAKKRPLVLAPPESPKPAPVAPAPAPTPTSNSGKQNKNKKAEVQKSDAPTKTTVAAPAARSAFEKRNKKKQQKKLKKSAAEAASKVAEGSKQQQPKELTKAQKKNAAIKAYKKQQKTKDKKQKVAREHTLEPVPFDEDKFHAIVNIANVKNIAKALKIQCEKEVANKKTSIFSDYQYFLNVVCFKIPNCPKRVVKLSLKHSLVDKDDDVVIVVPDLQRGAKVDYEPTIQHYEDLFRQAGVEGLKIVPFNQIRTECNTFEAVRKFGNTYDYFLCDGRLVGQVAGFTGKVFQKPRTTFHAVRLENQKTIKTEIEKALRRTAYKQLNKGDIISIPVGTHKYTIQQLAENVEHVVTQLKKLYPGGLGNIRSMNLKIGITGTSSLPLYISMAQPPAETPYVVGPREQRMLKMKKEANEVLSKFAMTKDADLIKLTKEQVEQKRQIKEAKAALNAKIEKPEGDGDDDNEDDKKSLPAKKAKQAGKVEAPQDDDDDGEVPAKKAKKEQKAEVEKDSKKKHVEEQAEPEDEDDDEEAENDSDDEDGDDDDDGEDDDEVDDDEDDDGEGNGDVDEGDDDDDDDEDDDDDDDEGDDDEEGDDNEDSD